jgi:hypothetical protein
MDDKSPPTSKVEARRTASEMRDKLVHDEMKKERAATDAKTARLKALRLAREAEEAAAPPPPPVPRAPRAPRKKKIS